MSKLTLMCPVLCLVTDPDVPDLVARVEVALSAGVNMLQLRGHSLPAAELYRLALVLRPLCRRYHALLIVNDRMDVGLAAGADGFQLGRRSLPMAVARRLIGEGYLLGASVHSCGEAMAAWADGADFLLAGTMFASHTHSDELPCGMGLLGEIREQLPQCSLLGIGGITQANAGEVMEAGADGVAVIGAILGAVDVKQAVSELRTAIKQKES